METTEKILKMMELDGRRNFLNGQVAEKVAMLTGIASAVEIEGTNKAKVMADKNLALSNLTRAAEAYSKADLARAAAEKASSEAYTVKTLAESKLAEYTSEVFALFDNRIVKINKAKAKTEKEKADVIAEAEKVQAEIEALQAELREQGIDLNIKTKAPRVSVI